MLNFLGKRLLRYPLILIALGWLGSARPAWAQLDNRAFLHPLPLGPQYERQPRSMCRAMKRRGIERRQQRRRRATVELDGRQIVRIRISRAVAPGGGKYELD